MDGISQKKKYRIRWYGSKNKLNNPVFEIKIRKNFEVYKRLFNLKKLNNLFVYMLCTKYNVFLITVLSIFFPEYIGLLSIIKLILIFTKII